VRGIEDRCAARLRETTVRPWPRTSAAPPALVLFAMLLFAMLLVVLPGCGHSPNTTFFALSAVRPDTHAHTAVAAPLQLRAVHIPELLDRTERVSEVSSDRLQINQFQQWGAPLADMIRRVLSEDLSSRLPAGTVVPPDAPAPPGTRGLVLDVQEFLPESNGQVVLQATWTVEKPGAGANTRSSNRTVLATGMQHLELPGGGSADAQVSAMSRLLGRLADAIAAGVNRPPSS